MDRFIDDTGVKPPAAVALACSLLALLGPAFVSRGDILVLANGDRIEGQVVSETDRQVSLRRRFAGRDILYVQNFPRTSVVRIEYAPLTSLPADLDAVIDEPAVTQPSPDTADATEPTPALRDRVEQWKQGGDLPRQIKDPRKFLRHTMDKWDEGQLLAAATDLTRLLSTISPRELDEISPDCQARLSMSLAQWAAHAHWTAAKVRAAAGPLRLTGVTFYELPALIPLVVEKYDAAIRSEIVDPAAAAETRPAEPDHTRTRPPVGMLSAMEAAELEAALEAPPEAVLPPEPRLTIVQWLDRPNELNVSRTQAAALAERIVFASSLLNERIRLDPAVRRDRALHSALVGQRMRLIALLRVASEQSSRSPRTEKKEAAKQRRLQVAEQERLRMQEQQRQEYQQRQSILHKALRMVQEQARQDVFDAQRAAAAAASPAGPRAALPDSGEPMSEPPSPPNGENPE